ncbi:hypothetical protein C8A00DRAFT_28669 [Chaetomidium leptoderma]|uniref:Uncharacterized protein n=1 Tax=Chaetomidium leptoderma TaxID=669021 RepID=A0AAN7A035_9PEZI|nr:hypothetical protein C8A00DRAFT_28669 [Chaetomidium leptoderma]
MSWFSTSDLVANQIPEVLGFFIIAIGLGIICPIEDIWLDPRWQRKDWTWKNDVRFYGGLTATVWVALCVFRALARWAGGGFDAPKMTSTSPLLWPSIAVMLYTWLLLPILCQQIDPALAWYYGKADISLVTEWERVVGRITLSFMTASPVAIGFGFLLKAHLMA